MTFTQRDGGGTSYSPACNWTWASDLEPWCVFVPPKTAQKSTKTTTIPGSSTDSPSRHSSSNPLSGSTATASSPHGYSETTTSYQPSTTPEYSTTALAKSDPVSATASPTSPSVPSPTGGGDVSSPSSDTQPGTQTGIGNIGGSSEGTVPPVAHINTYTMSSLAQPRPTLSVEETTYSTVVTEHSTRLVTTSNSFGVTTVLTEKVTYNSTVPVTSSFTTEVQPTYDSTGSATTQHTSGSGVNTAAIVGGILGGLATLLLLLGLLHYCRRTRRRATHESVWFGPRANHGGMSMLLDPSASNTSSLFLTADGGADEDITSADKQVAPIYRYGATSQAIAASTQSLVDPMQPAILPTQSESLPVFVPTHRLITPTVTPAQPLVTSARLVVSPPLRSADIRAQDPDPFANPRSRPDTVVSVDSPTINTSLPNPYQDPDLFPPEGRVAAWESQMHSARTSISGLHGNAANLEPELVRESLLSDVSAEALVEAGEAM